MEPREELDELLADLKQHRDELAVKLHLGAAEAKELWKVMEKKRDQLASKAKLVAGATEGAAGDVLAAARLLAEEIEQGYERIRKLL